jgi:hypothetical protein
MKEHPKIPKHIIPDQIFQHPNLELFPVAVHRRVFISDFVQFLVDSQVQKPMNEGNIVARIQAMPECTCKDGT